MSQALALGGLRRSPSPIAYQAQQTASVTPVSLSVCLKDRGRSVVLFGSVARGDETTGSDVDLLVDFEDDSSLMEP